LQKTIKKPATKIPEPKKPETPKTEKVPIVEESKSTVQHPATEKAPTPLPRVELTVQGCEVLVGAAEQKKSHMSLVELGALYDKVLAKRDEIDAVRSAEHVETMEIKVADYLYKKLESKVPKALLEEATLEILDIIDAAKDNTNLNNLETELNNLQKTFDDALQTVGEAVEFKDVSSFDVARKAKNPRMVYREGRLKILRSSKSNREMNSQRFIEEYPFVAAKIAKIELGKATTALEEHFKKQVEEKKIGGNPKHEALTAVDSFCTKSTTYKYEFEAGRTTP
jgi:hypothetical protein